MELKELFAGVEHRLLRGQLNTDITGICVDSRRAKAGDLFVAVTGAKADGHDYAAAAVARGATAVLIRSDRATETDAVCADLPADVAVLSADDTREILSELVNR
ncbi:MAG: Mur ligase domain-containing protein, partial [Clostridiales Family XIII bacterium]|nr:Mur ligase domain-containing protein [Clostridiales Family XIII bacterium]